MLLIFLVDYTLNSSKRLIIYSGYLFFKSSRLHTPMPLLEVTMGIISTEEEPKSIHALKNNKAGGLDDVTS